MRARTPGYHGRVRRGRFLGVFLAGFALLPVLDGFWVLEDRLQGTAWSVLFLAAAGALLASACRLAWPLFRWTLPESLRAAGRPSGDAAPFALGLAWALAPQLPLLASGVWSDRLMYALRWALPVTVLAVFLITALLAHGLRTLRLPAGGRLAGLLLLVYGATAAGFAWRDAHAWRLIETTRFAPAAAVSAAQRPNVLLIVLDTTRFEAIGGSWEGQSLMPWFNEYARRGRRFVRSYAGSNFTPPGHAALFTGRYPAECGTLALGEIGLPLEQWTLAECLRRQGYRTAGVVSNMRIGLGLGFSQGFEIYDDELVRETTAYIGCLRLAQSSLVRSLGGRLARQGVQGALKIFASDRWATVDAEGTTAQTAKVLDELAPGEDEPVFLFVNYIDQHLPYVTRHDLAEAFLPNLSEPDLEATRRNTLLFHNKLDELGEDLRSGAPRAAERARWVSEAYWEQCRELDEGLRDLFADLERRGILRDDTVVVVTADHGEHLGEQGYFLHGTTLREANVHVPLWISCPGVEPGLDESSIVSGVDFAPTILTAIGLPAAEWPSGLAGRPLQEAGDPERLVRFECGPLRGFLAGTRKMIAYDHGDRLEWIEAFDLAEDPREERNLIGPDAPEWVRAFAANPPFSTSSQAGTIIQGSGAIDLAALGYAGESAPQVPPR